MATAAERVAVPRDAVSPVAVPTQPGGHERLTQVGGVPVVELRAHLVQHRIGERVVRTVEGHEPGYFDNTVVHPPPFGSPGTTTDQPVEEFAVRIPPALADIDPGAVAQQRTFDRCRQLDEPLLDHRGSIDERTFS